MAFRPLIKSEDLISEVKSRPILYDTKGSHGNHEQKSVAWGEIGATLFSEKWNGFTSNEKDAVVKDLQVKWRSLRDNYSRHLRVLEQVKQGTSTAPKKNYIYGEQLSFLQPFINKRDRNTTTNSEEIFHDESSMLEDIKPALSSHDPIAISPTNSEINFSKTLISGTLTPLTSIDLGSLGAIGDQEPPMKKVAKCLEELTKMQREERLDDPLGNRKFLLSLLPFMKKLPDDVNLEVRLQLLSVLETYTSGKN